MEIKETDHYIQITGKDQLGPFIIDIQKDRSQLRIERDMESLFIDTDINDLKAIRDCLTEVIDGLAAKPKPGDPFMKSPVKPSLTRMVIYVPVQKNAKFLASVISDIDQRTESDLTPDYSQVTLSVFTNMNWVMPINHVRYSETDEPNSWHWPPRV